MAILRIFLAVILLGLAGAAAQSPDNRAHPWDTTERTDPALVLGEWNVTGWNPGNDKGRFDYRGVVTVRRRGEVFDVSWRIGQQRFQGVGILRGPIFSVAYDGGNAVYILRSEGLDGVWTPTDGDRLGREVWTR